MKNTITIITTTIIINILMLTVVFGMKTGEAEIIAGTSTAISPGIIEQFGGETVPEGYLLCDGNAVSRITYANLFKAIGTTYGEGDGSTTFNIPNFEGKVAVGKNSGTFNALGKTGGEETNKLTVAEMPAHTHSLSTGVISTTSLVGDIWDIANTGYKTTTGIFSYGAEKNNISFAVKDESLYVLDSTQDGYHLDATHNHTLSGNTSSAGSTMAHNNLQPYIVVNYIIKY